MDVGLSVWCIGVKFQQLCDLTQSSTDEGSSVWCIGVKFQQLCDLTQSSTDEVSSVWCIGVKFRRNSSTACRYIAEENKMLASISNNIVEMYSFIKFTKNGDTYTTHAYNIYP